MPTKRGPASPSQSDGTSDGKHDSADAADHAKLRPLPKLPMVRHGKQWFRCKSIKTTAAKVQLEYCGFEEKNQPFWLPLTSERLWRGSYKGKDWRHLVHPWASTSAMISVSTNHYAVHPPAGATWQASCHS